jgi:transmembrane sensor
VFIADPAWQVHDYRSAVGERRGIRLPDGSHLLLDAGTHLQVRRHIRSRQVVLVQGQARFQVQHSTWRPFEVEAGRCTCATTARCSTLTGRATSAR